MKIIGFIYLIIECFIFIKLISVVFKFFWIVIGESVFKVIVGVFIFISVSVILRIFWKNYVLVNNF